MGGPSARRCPPDMAQEILLHLGPSHLISNSAIVNGGWAAGTLAAPRGVVKGVEGSDAMVTAME